MIAKALLCAALVAAVCAQEEPSRKMKFSSTVEGKPLEIRVEGKDVSITLDGEPLSEDRMKKLTLAGKEIFVIQNPDGNALGKFELTATGGTLEMNCKTSVLAKQRLVLGVQLGTIDEGLADHLQLNPKEVVKIDSVTEGLPGAKAGLRQHDVVLEIEGRKPVNLNSLKEVLAEKRKGDEVTLKVLRRGGQRDLVAKLDSVRVDSVDPSDYDYALFDFAKKRYAADQGQHREHLARAQELLTINKDGHLTGIDLFGHTHAPATDLKRLEDRLAKIEALLKKLEAQQAIGGK